MALKQTKIIPGRNHVGPLFIVASLSFCIPVSVASPVIRNETCDVDIAGYCCRNETLSKPDTFELSCFSKDSWKNGSLPSRHFPNAAATPGAPILSENGNIDPAYRNLAFRIKVDSASILTVQCATAAPNVPSLLAYLKVQNVTNLIYIHCDLPQANLSFARIFDGNLSPVISMSLEDPLNIPDRVLREDLFKGLSTGLRNLSIAQNVDNKSLDLSDEFFKDFRSLRFLNLTASIARIPKDLGSLSNLTQLYLSGTTISKITSDAFSNLTSLDDLRIYNAPIKNFESKPFSNLKMLTVLEMSGLHATEIPNDIFSGLSRLRSLKLREWANLTTIQAEAFSNTPNLKRLELGVMPLLEILPTGLFKDLLNVDEIEIDDCGLKHLPTGLWPRSGKAPNTLSEIRIVNNKVETLPEYFFRGNTELYRVNLEQNSLQRIGKSLQRVPSLSRLNLYGNQLASISKGDFKGLNELEYLNLSRNGIEFIENGSFEKLSGLDSLILSDNKLQSFDNLIKAGNEAIASIYLSNNMITSFPDVPFDVLYSFDTLQMDDNLISTFEVPLFESDDTTFYLRRNRIELILFSKFEGVETLEPGEHLFYIDENPFKCNGENLNFIRYVRGGNMIADIAMFEDLDNCFCNGTKELIKEVTHFPEKKNCPEPCTCIVFPFENSTSVDCKNKDLASIPDLPPGITELNFEGNTLKTFPDTLSAYESLRIVNLKKNRLRSIDAMFSLALPNLQFLYVESNQLERLEVDPKTPLNFSVTLSDNPWICDCRAKPFKSYLVEYATKILDYSAIRCGNSFTVDGLDEFSLSRIPLDIMCPIHRPILLIVMSSVVTAFVLTLFVVILYFRNRSLVTAFTYIHFNSLFQLLSRDSDPDEDKRYDAFLSYATPDREVAMEVLNKLESIDADSPRHFEEPFELCFHERDFVAGQSIIWNIQNAVESSHRTIFILSQASLESSWSASEFEAAYKRMLDDPRNRLIVIINGDIPKFEDLNEDVRAVISTRNYLVWGERWFWKKLFYAMPHRNRTEVKTESSGV